MSDRPYGGKKIEGVLDNLLAGKLSNPEFIPNLVREFQQRNENESSAADIAGPSSAAFSGYQWFGGRNH